MESDIERLTLLRLAVEAGHTIGSIARLSDNDLRHLTQRLSVAPETLVSSESYFDSCLAAISDLDAESLEAGLSSASAVLGVDQFLAEVVIPLLAELGQGWKAGRIRIAQEHLASAVFRTHLERIRSSMRASISAPRLVVTTPTSEPHEFGALVAAIVAARAGWHTTYLGPNLPAEEIALAARRTGAEAIALSIVCPSDVEAVMRDIGVLRGLMGTHIPILVGGRASEGMQSVLLEHSITLIADYDSMRAALSGMRSASGANARIVQNRK